MVFLDKIYNLEIKNKFLSQYESSRDSYEYLFKKSYTVEFVLDKDLYQFNLDEIAKIFQLFEPSTKKVARFNGSVVSSYINWAIKEGYKKNENPLEKKGYNWFDQFVDPHNKIHLTEQELIEIEDRLLNAQDSVILRLLFEGIHGSKFSEILNIQKQHIDYNKKLIQVKDDKKGERIIKVSDRCLQLIKRAFSEEKYWNKNGTAENEKRLYSVLIDNNYLIRSNKTKTLNEDRADYFLIYRRFANIKDVAGYKIFSPNSLKQSGMICMAKDYFFEHGEVPNELLIQIAERYNISKVKNNGYLVHNYRLLREFITEDNINMLYGDY